MGATYAAPHAYGLERIKYFAHAAEETAFAALHAYVLDSKGQDASVAVDMLFAFLLVQMQAD